jgi:hypothetical protein
MIMVSIRKDGRTHVTAWCTDKEIMMELVDSIKDGFTFSIKPAETPKYSNRYTDDIFCSSAEKLESCCTLPRTTF